MEKCRKRALRRWRSFCVWMRRLKVDWAEHGWQWNPRPIWGKDRTTIIGWKSDLCGCFDLKDKQALRFKDTPNGCACMSCANPRRVNAGRLSAELTFSEQRAFLGDLENWQKRKRRSGIVLRKVNCRDCGRLIGSVWVKIGGSLLSKVKELGWDRRCSSCRRKYIEFLEK